MIALFCGSRHWTEVDDIGIDIIALPPDTIVVQGGAPGADAIAARLARERGLHVAEVKALWGAYGDSAGPRRNRAMLLLRPDVVYAYSLGGPGTRSMINAARDAGVRVIVSDPSVLDLA